MTEELLSKEEIRKARDEVAAEVLKESKEKEIALVKEFERKKLRQRNNLEEPMEQIWIDLPPSSDRITIDGVSYMSNTTPTVRQSVAIVMRDVMHRLWQHEATIKGEKKDYFTKRNTVLGPGGIRNPPSSNAGLRV